MRPELPFWQKQWTFSLSLSPSTLLCSLWDITSGSTLVTKNIVSCFSNFSQNLTSGYTRSTLHTGGVHTKKSQNKRPQSWADLEFVCNSDAFYLNTRHLSKNHTFHLSGSQHFWAEYGHLISSTPCPWQLQDVTPSGLTPRCGYRGLIHRPVRLQVKLLWSADIRLLLMHSSVWLQMNYKALCHCASYDLVL